MSTMIRGTAIAPGISKNGRFYSADMIAQAVRRAQPRIQASRMIMKSHHDAGDDTARVVGAIRSLSVAEDGSARFTAELADTSTGRDIAALVKGPRPFVDAVSISGYWLGKVQHVKVGNQTVETSAGGLDIESIDLTTRPGVDAARIVGENAYGKRYILEEAPWPVTPAGPGTAEPTARELAAMPADEFHTASSSYLASMFGGPDGQRPPSPWNDPDRWVRR